MKDLYTQAFDALEPDERQKQDMINNLKVIGCEHKEAAVKSVSYKKSKGSFKAFLLSTRRGIAALTAAILLVVTLGVAVPVGIFISGGGMYRTIQMLRNSLVDMTDVAAFGVMQVKENKEASNGQAPAGTMSTLRQIAPIRGPVAGGRLETQEELEDFESDYDWDPEAAQVLVTIADDGNIEEVVYVRTNGRGMVRQDKLGYAAMIHVATEFTYVMYVSEDSWPEYYDAQQLTLGSYMPFHCAHNQWQTIVIHNETGKVFPLQDIFPTIGEIAGQKQYTLAMYPHDDIISIHPMYGDPKHIHFELSLREQSLIYERLVHDEDNISIQNIKRDRYGNYFIFNDGRQNVNGNYDHSLQAIIGSVMYDTLDARIGNKLFFSGSLYFGTDKRVYAVNDGRIQVYNADLELEDAEDNIDTAFEEITQWIEELFGNPGKGYILRNEYMFSDLGDVYKRGEDGRLSLLDKKITGLSFPSNPLDSHLLSGELFVLVDIGGVKKLVQADFSSFNEADFAITYTEIINAAKISCNGRWLIASQTLDTVTSFSMVTVEDGKTYCRLVVDTNGVWGVQRLIK